MNFKDLFLDHFQLLFPLFLTFFQWFLIYCWCFFLIGTNKLALAPSSSFSSSFSTSSDGLLEAVLLLPLEYEAELLGLLVDGSIAGSGWQEFLLLINGKRSSNHLLKPLSSTNLLMPVAVCMVKATVLHMLTHHLNLFHICCMVKGKECRLISSFKTSL